jgi:hypothetical protein
MRPLGPAILIAGLSAATIAAAEPVAAPGFELRTISRPGAIFAGLARDGDVLLVTNLGDGRLYRLEGEEPIAFGPQLPHGLDVIGDPTGPYRIAPYQDGYLIAQGWTPIEADAGPNDHALLLLDRDGGIEILDNDFWNPFDFIVVDGTVFVVDAARNSIERLQPGVKRTTFATFDRLKHGPDALRTLSPTEFAGADYEVDAVPTGIALGEGRLSVALFGGFPFLPGGGRIVSMALDGDRSVQVDLGGLNAPVSIARRGRHLLILEHGLFDQATGFQPGTGRLISFDDRRGSREVLLDGLTRPASVLVWNEGRVIVSELGGNLHFLDRKPY